MRSTRDFLLLGVVAGAPLFAQSDVIQLRVPPPADPNARQTMMYMAAPTAGAPAAAFDFVRSEFGSNAVVKGSPYTAEATTENVQVLADGNRIAHRDTTTLARDGAGRTRRDMTMPLLAGMNPADAPKFSFIHDPATNASYTLDHNNHTARKSTGQTFNVQFMKKIAAEGAASTAAAEGRPQLRSEIHREIRTDVAGESGAVIGGAAVVGGAVGAGIMTTRLDGASPDGPGKTENLGKQTIEGVIAEGTRTVQTIPAGQIGNERAIEIVSERWYSPDLQTVIQSKHVDPRSGETTYRLTNIRRSEPDKSLFEVPSTYTLQSSPDRLIRVAPAPKE